MVNVLLSDELTSRPSAVESDSSIDYSTPKYVEILSDLANSETIQFEQNIAFICESFLYYDFDAADIYTEANTTNLLGNFIQTNNALITNVDSTVADSYVEAQKNDSDVSSKLFEGFLAGSTSVTSSAESTISSLQAKLKLAKENKLHMTSSDDIRIMNAAISSITSSMDSQITLIEL